MTTYSVKVGDTAQPWTDTLTLDGAAINLSGATVHLNIKPVAGGVNVQRTATIVNAAAGTVSYDPVSGDVGTAGSFHLEWEITFSGGKKLTVPNDGYIRLDVIEDLD